METCIQNINLEPRQWQGVLDTTLCYKLASDLRQDGDFLQILRSPPPIRLTAKM